MPESPKYFFPSRITSRAIAASSLLSISASAEPGDDAILARGAHREREVGEAALEQRRIGPIGDDADGQ